MTVLVPSTVVVLMKKIALRISVRADDFTSKRANIAGNGVLKEGKASI